MTLQNIEDARLSERDFFAFVVHTAVRMLRETRDPERVARFLEQVCTPVDVVDD